VVQVKQSVRCVFVGAAVNRERNDISPRPSTSYIWHGGSYLYRHQVRRSLPSGPRFATSGQIDVPFSATDAIRRLNCDRKVGQVSAVAN